MYQQQVEFLLLSQISHETFSTSQQTLDNMSFSLHSNHRCDMHMKMFVVFFDLVVLPPWLPSWFAFFFFCMSPHCDLSTHNLYNVYQSSLYYFVFLLLPNFKEKRLLLMNKSIIIIIIIPTLNK
jgi:hypothetical protein